MLTLLWKDWRQQRVVICAGLLLALAPYFIAAMYWLSNRADIPVGESDFYGLLMAAGTGSVVLSVISFAMVAGVAFASERRDRSAEFLLMLAPSRAMHVAGKSIFCLVQVTMLWILGIAPALLAAYLSYHGKHFADFQWVESFFSTFRVLGAIAVMAFGLSWFLSSFHRSAAISAGAGLGLTLFILAAIASGGSFVDALSTEHTTRAVLLTGFISGPIGYVAGCVIYLKRVQP